MKVPKKRQRIFIMFSLFSREKYNKIKKFSAYDYELTITLSNGKKVEYDLANTPLGNVIDDLVSRHNVERFYAINELQGLTEHIETCDEMKEWYNERRAANFPKNEEVEESFNKKHFLNKNKEKTASTAISAEGKSTKLITDECSKDIIDEKMKEIYEKINNLGK